ncbi:Linoleate diol synthase-like protein [Hapsidospora chrysogenum ATCC 11550]|uniref:Linoleate diol synthase-like protein n=1 Tax=Hapsidospora chrysogenum (strain ATCC 11550 / CBS 779.69 / DSM 880 / IAM 14645 / JCM 23072 / IMI 49137) TaxID=857340 RepID=A0A086TFL5_HAPC1|nr:Linoleate diol synthase-like protein [Hapsidospora chrysogenum ATCC 11550]
MAVSVEFNLVYRWHSVLSDRDARWAADEMSRLLGGRDPECDPHQRESASRGLQCRPDGAYDDDSLVATLRGGIENKAGSFGANQVPGCLRPVLL